MENRYVKCRCCGKRVYFGEVTYRYKGYGGLYCSDECFTKAYGEENKLNLELAENTCCKVYDDDARKRELQEQMERLIKQMDSCKAEFESICNNTR